MKVMQQGHARGVILVAVLGVGMSAIASGATTQPVAAGALSSTKPPTSAPSAAASLVNAWAAIKSPTTAPSVAPVAALFTAIKVPTTAPSIATPSITTPVAITNSAPTASTPVAASPTPAAQKSTASAQAAAPSVAEHANVAAPAAAAVSVAAPKPPTAVAPPAGPVDGASSSTSGAGDDKSTSAAPAAPESGDGGSSTSMAWDSDATTVTGITKPSQELKLTFYGQGLIASRPVKEGDFVHKGQVLMTEDAEVEQLEYDSMKVESGSHLPIDYAVADYNSKCIVRDRLQAAANDQVANESELQEAIANAEEARIKIDLSKEELRQKSLETDKQGAKVAKMQMVAPIDGIVEKLNLDIGEMVDPNKPEGVVVLVKNDPIWVEVHLPSVEAARLKLGDEFDLKYEGEDQWLPEKGRVNFLDPVVDAASDTRLVRLEVRNPSNRPAGLHVAVRLPEHLAAAN